MNDDEYLIPNEIIRSKRKSISLIIKNNGEFLVRAPLRATEREVYKFINLKAKWIITKRKDQLNNKVNPLTFDKLEKITLLGKEYDIVFSPINNSKMIDDKIIIPNENPKEHLIKYLKKIARNHITERVKLISNLFNFEYAKISITSAKSCWGSCGTNNNLHFSYRLMLCPEDVVDYVVLHELCHTKVKNHSTNFWSLVEKCNPFYKIHEKWLKKNRAIMEKI